MTVGAVAAIFLGLLALHTLHGVGANLLRRENGRRIPLLLYVTQTPLFVLSAIIGWRAGVISRDLLSPLAIGGGIAAGHVVFAASLLATHPSLKEVGSFARDLRTLYGFLCKSPLVLSRFLIVALAEEMIWRVAAQVLFIQLTGSVIIGIGLTAVLFSVVHKHFFRNSLVVSVEFLGFSVLLGVLYHLTFSYMFVVLIHAMRDIEIAYLDYLEKLDELGDEEAAITEVERGLLGRPTEVLPESLPEKA